MSTNTNLLGKGLMRLGILVFLFILAPITITMGFKGINSYTESPEIYFAYALLIVGAALIIYAIYFAFKTFSVLQSAIFDADDKASKSS